MDFFEKVGETINSKSREAAGKAKDIMDIANLRSQINMCEEVIKKNYMEIGRTYYEQYQCKEKEENEFAEQCTAIYNAKKGVAALEEKIRDIKGI